MFYTFILLIILVYFFMFHVAPLKDGVLQVVALPVRWIDSA